MLALDTAIGARNRKWYNIIGGDRSLLTTPIQTTATFITSGTQISQLHGFTYASVRSLATTRFVSPLWISTSTSDVLCTFYDSTGTISNFQMHVPAGAVSENGGNPGDNSAGFIDASRPYKYVTINDCRIGSNSSNATASGVVSATNNFIMCGPGNPGGMIIQDITGPVLMDLVNGAVTGAAWGNGDNVSGCITYYDLLQCNANPNFVIQHSIGVNIGTDMFSSAQLLWPLAIGDSGGTGSIYEGCILVIPPGTTRPTGQTRGYYALFDLFMQFGGIVNNVTTPGQVGIKTMPGDTATASLVADMDSNFASIIPLLGILNYSSGTAGAQYSLATLKGRLSSATSWSDAYPAPPPIDLTPTGRVAVLPSTFGAWQAANGLGSTYNSIW